MGNNEIRIRKARSEILDAIKTLADANKTALGFVLRPALEYGIRQGWILVAEQGGTVVGFVHYRHRRDRQTTLYEICVDEGWRRKGVGRLLLEALAAESQSLGKTCVLLKAPIDIPANEFYEKLGFALTKIERGKRRQLNVWEIHLRKNKK